MDEHLQIDGLIKQRKELEALMTSNPEMERRIQKLIRKVLLEARRSISKDAKAKMDSDPRQAYKAVKSTVYRRILGGSVSILSKRRGVEKVDYQRQRSFDPSKRGGNRRQRSQRTADLQSYWGASRGFILRFINAGTKSRKIVNWTSNGKRVIDKWNKHPNTGNRGRIAARNFFSTSSQAAMEKAAESLTALIDEMIKNEMK